MIRLVTFDLDDTLWDVRPALIRAEQAQWDWLISHFGERLDRHNSEHHRRIKQQLLADEPALRHHISDFRRRFIESLLIDAGISEHAAAPAASEAFAAFLAERHRVDVFPEAQPMLEALCGHYTLGALTNGNADVMKTPLGEYFDFVFRAEEVGQSKPGPALFAAASEAAGITPSEMVHVGDHIEHDIVGARNFGARTVWFNVDGEHSPEADASISQLSALPDVIRRLSSDP